MGKFRISGSFAPLAFPPRRPSGYVRYSMLVVLIILITYAMKHSDPNAPNAYGRPGKAHPAASVSSTRHPIDTLIEEGDRAFEQLISKRTNTVSEAAAAYRKKHGRHPPPGFDVWFEFAQNRSSLIVEDFFDQIYHDLEPFWGIDPKHVRKEANGFEMTVHIRDGKATTKSDWHWTLIWLDLFQSLEHLLPDMDLALNPMDEPRIVAPWETVNDLLEKSALSRKLAPVNEVVDSYQNLLPPGEVDKDVQLIGQTFEDTQPLWALARRGCHPDSLARTTPMEEWRSFAEAPALSMDNTTLHTFEGYVSNTSLAKDPCHQPDLQGNQGILIEPLTTSITKTMFPLFGGSKLSVNNEILLPAPVHWADEERFTGGAEHGGPWEGKRNQAVWRGVATGGRNRNSNWRRFQRHRFVAMNNGTKVSRIQQGHEKLESFVLPEEKYKVRAHQYEQLGPWLEQTCDMGFIDLMCEPRQDDNTCPYTSPHYKLVDSIDHKDVFNYKYLPDVDGNSFSGRFLGFLRSTGLPIKSTIFREWHDSRIVPWKHYIPMDARFGDWYGILEYFVGYEGRGAHDEQANTIAQAGKAWAETVLRREDEQVYTLRLLLEYARISDDRRENMGWVDDLLGKLAS